MIARWGLVVALLFSVAGFAAPDFGHRSVLEQDYEIGFKKHLAGKNAKAVRERYLERMMKLRYRTQAYMDAFEKDLTKGLPLSEMDSYAAFLAMHPIQDSADDEGLFVYRRSLETAWTGSASSEEKATALATLDEIYNWIKERPEEDRIIISDWIDRLEDMYKEFDTSMRETETKSRKIASVIPSFNFAEYNFGHQDNLSKVFSKHKDEIKKNAQDALKWKDTAADGTIAEYKSAAVKNRDIASISAPLFKPSEGPEGNFDGERMNAHNFAFTFDDGPAGANTDRILDIATGYKDPVNTKGVPLTFFNLEVNAPHYPKQIERIKALGFTLNNHSWTHPMFNLLQRRPNFPQIVKHEVVDADVALSKQFGEQPALKSSKIPYYRCPYGSCIYGNHNHGVPEVRKAIASIGEIHILWTVDSADWANKKRPEHTRDITIAQLERTEKDTNVRSITRGVILMHDIHPRTPDAFRMVLDWIKQKNDAGAHIALVTVADALAQANGTSTKVTP